MRLYIACLLLIIVPAAGVFGFKQYQALEAQRHRAPRNGRGEVLFFNASWCGPCRHMKPIVASMRRQGYRMRDVDVDSHRELVEKYGIHAVPTFVFLENGSEVNRLSGGTTSERLRKLCSSSAYIK
jgi:thiol-disulfide isomerase/thioredoxin